MDADQRASIPQGKRGLTFRAEIGKDDGTLSEEDIRAFQDGFKKHLNAIGLELRA